MRKNKNSSTIPEEFNMSLHDKAVRLVEGGFVWQDGHYVGAKKVPLTLFPCEICDMDSICHDEMVNLCEACDDLGQNCYRLYLVAYRDNH